jgi:hypothetical protein
VSSTEREVAVQRGQRGEDGADSRRQLGDRLVMIGSALFAVGLLATLVTVVPLFLDSGRLPTVFYLAALLAPVGVATALTGVVMMARPRQR